MRLHTIHVFSKGQAVTLLRVISTVGVGKKTVGQRDEGGGREGGRKGGRILKVALKSKILM